MRLLLTHGYFLYEDPKELQIMKPYVPLGILYLSSHLRAKGFDVDVYDSTFGSREELFRILSDGPPAVLGISGNLMTRRNVLDILGAAKGAGWKVVLGGPEPASYAEEYLQAGADVVVEGEAELTVEELLPALGSRSIEGIHGIIFQRPDGSIARTPARQLIPNLDRQPWPDRQRVDIPRYLQVWRERHGAGSVSVITARESPSLCPGCSHSTFGKPPRRRWARAVVDEVQW